MPCRTKPTGPCEIKTRTSASSSPGRAGPGRQVRPRASLPAPLDGQCPGRGRASAAKSAVRSARGCAGPPGACAKGSGAPGCLPKGGRGLGALGGRSTGPLCGEGRRGGPGKADFLGSHRTEIFVCSFRWAVYISSGMIKIMCKMLRNQIGASVCIFWRDCAVFPCACNKSSLYD